MATFVGKQSSLSSMLESLLELEYDAIAAYSAAIDRFENPALKATFSAFRSDHERHVREITDSLLRMGVDPPVRADAKAILTQGKVVIGKLAGDAGILLAMRSNEHDTNTAYERVVSRQDLDAELRSVFTRSLSDEHRHHGWIEEQLRSTAAASAAPSPASEEFVGFKP